MKQVFDPKGNELFPTLVQIVERNAQGKPTRCVIRYDDETMIGLKEKVGDIVPPENRFLLLWSPRTELAAGDLGSKMHEIEKDLASTAEKLLATRKDALIAIDENKRIVAELEQKTIALRDLQKERDPQHLERLVAQRTETLSKLLNTERQRAAAQLEEQAYLVTPFDDGRDGGRYPLTTFEIGAVASSEF